jgi:hypothetical protein
MPLWLCAVFVHVSVMEQQPVRRRRRRRRSAKARSESIAWLTYIFSLAKRAWRWVPLLAIVGLILFLGLGAPVTPIDTLLSWWGHW